MHPFPDPYPMMKWWIGYVGKEIGCEGQKDVSAQVVILHEPLVLLLWW
jgi:hypothetical protein